MSLVEQLHAARKERLARMGALPVNAPMVPKELLEKETRRADDLQARVEHQKEIIAELNATIAKQRLIIRKFADETEAPTPRIADVIAVVAKHYGMTKQMLTGSQRSGNIVFPRQVGYSICRDLGYGWLAIGRAFLKDHTSALHGARLIGERMQTDPKLCEEIEAIKTALDKHVGKRIEASKAMLA